MKKTLLNELNIKIKTKKTKVLVCNKNNNIKSRVYLKNKQELVEVEEFAYLESIKCEDGKSGKELIK